MKSEDPADKLKVNHIIYHCTEAIRIVGILLQPYMPNKSAELLDMIGVDASKRSYEHATWGSDIEYGTAKTSTGKGAWDGLFPPLPLET